MSSENRYLFPRMRIPNASGAVVRRGHDIAAVATEYGEVHRFSVAGKTQVHFCPDIPDAGRAIIGCRHHALAVASWGNAPHARVMLRKSIDWLALIESPQKHGLVSGRRHQQGTQDARVRVIGREG